VATPRLRPQQGRKACLSKGHDARRGRSRRKGRRSGSWGSHACPHRRRRCRSRHRLRAGQQRPLALPPMSRVTCWPRSLPLDEMPCAASPLMLRVRRRRLVKTPSGNALPRRAARHLRLPQARCRSRPPTWPDSAGGDEPQRGARGRADRWRPRPRPAAFAPRHEQRLVLRYRLNLLRSPKVGPERSRLPPPAVHTGAFPGRRPYSLAPPLKRGTSKGTLRVLGE